MSVPVSQNGYQANDPSQMQTYAIGNGRQVQLRKGDPGYVLAQFANWFDSNIEDIDPVADDWGYAARTIRGDAATLSNHASGTALDLNAEKHPLGKRGTFTKLQAAAIRHELRTTFADVIRWGGDYVNRADEMHFEINAGPAAVSAVATKLRTQGEALMVTPEDEAKIRAIVSDELAAFFRANDGDKLPHIGNARVKSPNGSRVITLAQALGVRDAK